MKMKTGILFLVCAFVTSEATFFRRRNIAKSLSYDNAMDVEDFSVYYNVDTNTTIREMMPRPWYTPGWLLRLPFSGGKCECEDFRCVCCTGIRINAFNFDRKTCAVLTYDPTPSTIDLEVKMNNDSVFKRSFSARNAPPFCVPVVVPYLPPGLVDFCIRLFDVTVINQMLHVCMDMDTRVDKAPVVILHFDCVDMGLSGISLSKPGTGQTTKKPDLEEATMIAHDPIYDDDSPETTTPMFSNSIKYI